MPTVLSNPSLSITLKAQLTSGSSPAVGDPAALPRDVAELEPLGALPLAPGGALDMARLLDGIRVIDAANFIAGPVSTTIMADFGRVALNRADIGFDHFRHSYATGLTIRAGGFPQVWLLFAWGGGEGTHTTGYISPGLLGGSSRPSLF